MHSVGLRNYDGSDALVTTGMQSDWSKMMGDPREYEGGNSDEGELLPEDDLPLNDGDEAIEEEDAG